MFKNIRIIALITARAGSKGLPGKNIKPFFGKPLLAWSIFVARKSKYVDTVMVSTDGKEVADVARRYGAEVPFLRPPRLATSGARLIDVITHHLGALKKRGESYDCLLLLQPTSPLRTAEDIDASIELMFKKNARSVISVSESVHHPWLAQRLLPDGGMKYFSKSRAMNKNRQELPRFYEINGAIYLIRTEALMRNKKLLFRDSYAYIMPRERSVDIDTIDDFQYAEYLKRKSR